MRDIKLRTRLLIKHILISSHLAILEIKVLGKVLRQMPASSLPTISRLDSQSKLKMITLFSSRYVGVPQRYSNMAAPYWAL